jgi:hypothetical protein
LIRITLAVDKHEEETFFDGIISKKCNRCLCPRFILRYSSEGEKEKKEEEGRRKRKRKERRKGRGKEADGKGIWKRHREEE